jgi:hypothetical protein
VDFSCFGDHPYLESRLTIQEKWVLEYAQANTTQWEQSAWGDDVIHMSDGTRSRDLLAS